MKTFNIPSAYKSPIIASIKEKRRVKDKLKKDFSPTVLEFDTCTVLLARHFGFCYGVENAVEIAYSTIEANPDKNIFLLSEMIHNPTVNQDLLERGVRFLMDTEGQRLETFEKLQKDDIVIVPAFGTTIELQNELAMKGIDPYTFDTTCPFVEKVWNRATQIGQRGYTVIIHGKPNHEETRATFSHSNAAAKSLIIKDLAEAVELAKYIRKEKDLSLFYEDFKGRYSDGFDVSVDLERYGVVNQTTMLANETQEIANYLKDVIVMYKKLEESEVPAYFASTRDTLCYATNDNQDATYELMKQRADFAIVVGGYNSSNTTHLVELLEKNYTTFFVSDASKISTTGDIQHFDIHTQMERTTLLDKYVNPRILLSSGASCPDATMEAVLRKLVNLYELGTDFEKIVDNISL